MKTGWRFRDQMRRLNSIWDQGQHLVISGDTGSGKTTLGRYIDDIRIERGSFLVVFVVKKRDDTISQDYAGWTRWEKWKRNPSPHENRVLLWPDITKTKTTAEALALQKEVFSEAISGIWRQGKWTVDFDEGLYMCSRDFMNMGDDIGMMQALGRSDKVTLITKMQRPSNVPLIVYGSASNAFIGRCRLAEDQKRLAELGGREEAKQLMQKISQLGRHDFLWIPVAKDWPPEIVNLRK